MKVVVVGGGVISNKLVSTSPAEVSCPASPFDVFPMFPACIPPVIEECQSTDIIVYFAYHYRVFPKN